MSPASTPSLQTDASAVPANPDGGPVHRLSRRTAIQWMLQAAALAASPAAAPERPGVPSAVPGYGLDPDLLRVYQPGEVWPLTLSLEQRRIVVALCEVILPAEAEAPSAVAVGVPDFIDEWVSAPYPEQRADRKIVLAGLDWIEDAARRRHRRGFADLASGQRDALCAELLGPGPFPPEWRTGVAFFTRMRHLVAGGYYTTPAGMNEIGFVGNTSQPAFAGPPPEVLRLLGLT